MENDQLLVNENIYRIVWIFFFLDGVSIQSTSSITKDRSNYSKQRLFSIEKQEKIGLNAKRILDWGRIEYLNANGFNAHLKVYASKNITLENIALIATPTSD
jgi:hypothetical protein